MGATIPVSRYTGYNGHHLGRQASGTKVGRNARCITCRDAKLFVRTHYRLSTPRSDVMSANDCKIRRKAVAVDHTL